VSPQPAAESEQQFAALVTATVFVEQQKIGLHLLLQQLGCLWCCLQWHSLTWLCSLSRPLLSAAAAVAWAAAVEGVVCGRLFFGE